MEAESFFLEYLSQGLNTFSSLHFALSVFEGVVNNLIKRRDFVNKKYGGLGEDEPEKDHKEYKDNKDNRDNKEHTKKLTKNTRVEENNNFNFSDYAYKDGTRFSMRKKMQTIQTKNERQFRSKKMTVS